MNIFQFDDFWKAWIGLGKIIKAADELPTNEHRLGEEQRTEFLSHIETALPIWTEFKFGHSLIAAKTLKETIENRAAKVDLYADAIGLHRVALTETKGLLFIQIAVSAAEYYRATSPLFGGDVDLKFASASFEISEAGKCFALGRYTACVFHLMRVMEVALDA
jgi:hypothetical protein